MKQIYAGEIYIYSSSGGGGNRSRKMRIRGSSESACDDIYH